MVKDCKSFYLVQKNDGCYNIAHDKGMALSDLYAWNPAVKNDCSGLQANVYICVGITGTPGLPTSSTTTKPGGTPSPTPTQPGISIACNKYYKAASNDNCQEIADKYGISLQDL